MRPTSLAGTLSQSLPTAPPFAHSTPMPTILGVVRSQAIRCPAQFMVANTALGAVITKFRDPVPVTGPRSTEKPPIGRDAEPEKFRLVEHPEASTAVSNRTMTMLARRLRSEKITTPRNLLGSSQIMFAPLMHHPART